MKLNLGCGSYKRDGYIDVDLWEGAKPDKVVDLFRPDWWMEFGENAVDTIYCGHFVEHIPHGNEKVDMFFTFMDNCYKVMKDGAVMTIRWPHYASFITHIEPTHRRSITQLTWRYTDATWRRSAKVDYYPLVCDFSYKITEVLMTHPPVLRPGHTGDMTEQDKFALSHYVNIIQDEQAELTCHKPARQGDTYEGP